MVPGQFSAKQNRRLFVTKRTRGDGGGVGNIFGHASPVTLSHTDRRYFHTYAVDWR